MATLQCQVVERGALRSARSQLPVHGRPWWMAEGSAQKRATPVHTAFKLSEPSSDNGCRAQRQHGADAAAAVLSRS